MGTHRLLLLRHGQSTWNAEGKWQGLADPPLSELGMSQAAGVASALNGIEFTAIYSSDLQRARQTAEIIAQSLGLPVLIEPDLRERDVGSWAGLTTNEIHDQWPDVARARAAGELVAPHDSNNDGYNERAITTIARIMNDEQNALVLVVTHGGFMRTIERALCGRASDKISNLSGRWVETNEQNKLVAGELFIVDDVNDSSTTNVL